MDPISAGIGLIGSIVGIAANGIPMVRQWYDERYQAPVIRSLEQYVGCKDGTPGDDCRASAKARALTEAEKLEVPGKWVLDPVWASTTPAQRSCAVLIAKLQYAGKPVYVTCRGMQ